MKSSSCAERATPVRTVVGLPGRVVLLRALPAAGLLRCAQRLPLRRAAVGQHRWLLPACVKESRL